MYYNTNTILTPDLKMAEAIQQNPYLNLLLEHFGITTCLQDKSIVKVCEDANINTDLFIAFANLYNGAHNYPVISNSFDQTIDIVNYLKKSHQYYLGEIYPTILSIIKKITEVNKHQEVELVEKFFIKYFNEVREHLEYEEKVVFPFILNLYRQLKESAYKPETSNYSVKEYKEHHDDIEEKLNDLKNLLVKYLPYDNDHSLRRKLLFNLVELEYDIHIHSKIEDILLIPLVSKMEDYLKDGNK